MSLSRYLLSAVLFTALAAPCAFAQTDEDKPEESPPASLISLPDPTATVTHADLPELVRQVLENNPDIVMEAAKKYRAKMEADSRKAAKEGLAKHEAELFGDTTSPSVGDPKKANVTMIEFFDYHCGYCKQMLPTLTKLVGEDKKLRIIFREFPILSEDSVLASHAALAVNHIAPEKYFDYYSALLGSKEKFTETMLLDQAKALGLDPDKVKAEMNKDYITTQLDDNRKLAEELGIRGTPAIILPHSMTPGAISYEDLRDMIDDVRTGKPIPDEPASKKKADKK